MLSDLKKIKMLSCICSAIGFFAVETFGIDCLIYNSYTFCRFDWSRVKFKCVCVLCGEPIVIRERSVNTVVSRVCDMKISPHKMSVFSKFFNEALTPATCRDIVHPHTSSCFKAALGYFFKPIFTTTQFFIPLFMVSIHFCTFWFRILSIISHN